MRNAHSIFKVTIFSCALVYMLCPRISLASIPPPIIIEPEARLLYEHVKQWSESLQTFKGEYMLEIFRPDANPPVQIYWQEYRYGGEGRRYLSTNWPTSSGEERHLFLAMLNNRVSSLWGRNIGTEREEYFGQVDDGTWRVPRGVFINPLEPFGKSVPEDTLFGQTTATYKIFKRDSYKILSQWSHAASKDIWVDAEGNIVRINFTIRPRILYPMPFIHELVARGCILGFDLHSLANDEVISIFDDLVRLAAKDPLDIYSKRYSLELDQHKVINGVSFPFWVKSAGYANAYTEADISGWLDILDKKFEAGTISLIQYALWEAEGEIFSRNPNSYQILQITNANEIEVNTPIHDNEFKIPSIDGALILNVATGESYVEINKWYASPLFHIVLILFFACVFMMLIACAIIYYLRDS